MTSAPRTPPLAPLSLFFFFERDLSPFFFFQRKESQQLVRVRAGGIQEVLVAVISGVGRKKILQEVKHLASLGFQYIS